MIQWRAAPVAFLVLALSGCGATRLQTARTVPRGETRTTVAAGVVSNNQQYLPDFRVDGFPLEVMVRHGATDQIDWGIRLFLGLGLLADVKWNLLPSESRTALALSAGLGGASDTGADSERRADVLHVPLTVTASRDLLPWFTPYAAIGYSTYWIFNYGVADPSAQYAPRSGTGDGLLMLHVGIELSRASGRALLLEYAYARPVVNDPGDFYGFATNHFFSIGVHTGRASNSSH
jgi:hypothetical protein